MAYRVRVEGKLAPGAPNYTKVKLLAQELQLPLREARVVLRELPATLPVALSQEEAENLARQLSGEGLHASAVTVPDGGERYCVQHPRFLEAAPCSACGAPVCVLCQRGGEGSCPSCERKAARRRNWKRLRVGVLLVVLAGTLLLAWREYRRRYRDWSRSYQVAVILVERSGAAVSDELLEGFREMAPVVEEALHEQRRRYDDEAQPPFAIEVFGAVHEPAPPPALPEGGLLTLIEYNWELARYAASIERALGIDGDAFDARLFVRVATPAVPSRQAVEGASLDRGEIGVVTAELAEESIDFVWFVTVHELFHTCGATDKYDLSGHARVPEGLADPAQEPLYPQEKTEIMARGRPLSLSEADVPGPAGTWVVGAWTAGEIGWGDQSL